MGKERRRRRACRWALCGSQLRTSRRTMEQCQPPTVMNVRDLSLSTRAPRPLPPHHTAPHTTPHHTTPHHTPHQTTQRTTHHTTPHTTTPHPTPHHTTPPHTHTHPHTHTTKR